MPRTGDVMILKSDATLKPCANFTAQIQTLDIPGEVKAGYSPIGFVRCGRSACRMSKVGAGIRPLMKHPRPSIRICAIMVLNLFVVHLPIPCPLSFPPLDPLPSSLSSPPADRLEGR